jgi:cytochrome b6-f complex iron-sulfur subunit
MDEQSLQNEDTSSRPCNDGRRTFCKACIGTLSIVSAGMVGFPIVSFMARPQTLDLNKPLEIPLDRLNPGQAQYVEYRGQQVIVLAGQNGPMVFAASCPHLGCNVIWDTGDGVFRCPCHGAMFNGTGDVIRGPVSNSLRKIPFEIKDGKIIVSTEV